MDSPTGIVITTVVIIALVIFAVGYQIWLLEKEKRRQRPE